MKIRDLSIQLQLTEMQEEIGVFRLCYGLDNLFWITHVVSLLHGFLVTAVKERLSAPV